MSTTIDQRVVEMRFDHGNFKKNTEETMSLLDKLKQKLNLSGAAKGLENINTTSNKVNMNNLSNALTTVQTKFSALEVVGVTALANITNSAVNAGKRIVESLTVAPISDGFKEYEMMLNTVQTTMAATGLTAEEVEKHLKSLDDYADKTVYSTADMLNNLPKFTNAGVELEAATQAMIGIANATALAGGDASKASIAFYNLGQAIGTGYLTRMDYNSINNAGIATMEWKKQMVEAAIAAGTLTKVGDDLYDTGSQQLTLQQLFIDGLQDQWATTDVMMKVFKDYGDETTEIGKKSYSAAQDIKTFTMMMESLKATAGTGWKDTWQIIFGDLGEAKVLWTGLTNFISKIITGMADARNAILESALGRSFKHLLDGFNNATDSVKSMVNTVKDYAVVVDDIIGGKWGNGQARWDALTEAGYDWAHAQNLVNEKLGNSLRRATSYTEAQEGVTKAQTETTEATAEFIVQLSKMSDAELKAKGYTDEQIKALRELARVAKQTGIPLKEFIENIDQIDGRYLLINSFKNAGQGIVAVFTAIKDAWGETIGFLNGDHIFNFIAGLHKFSTYLTVSDTAAKNLKDTFKGVFSILDLVFTLIGGPIKIGLKILGQLIKALDISAGGILEITGRVGRAITAFHDWLNELIDFTAVFEFLAPYIKAGAAAVRDWFKSLGQSDVIKNFTERLTSAKEAIVEWFKGLKEAENIPKYILQGLVNGLKEGVGIVVDTMIELGIKILEAIKKVLGIHSPSTEFFEIGKNIIQGLANGIQNGVSGLWKFLKSIGAKCIEIFKQINFGKILAAGIGIGMILVIKNLVSVLDKFAAPLEGLGNMFNGIGEAFEGLGASLKANVWEKKTKAIRNIAISIAILAGSIYLLAKIDTAKLWICVGAIAALGAVIGVLAFAASKMGDIKDMGKSSLSFIAITASLFLLAKTLQNLSKIDSEKLVPTLSAFAGMIVGLAALFVLFGLFVKGEAAKNIDKAGIMIAKISGSLMLMAIAVKLIASVGTGDIIKGIAVIGTLSLLFAGLVVLSKFSGSSGDKAGKMISKMAFALLVTVAVIKLASMLDGSEIAKGLAVMTGVSLLFAGLVAVSKFAGQHAAKAGAMMLQMSIALLITVSVIKMISGLSLEEIAKGLTVMTVLGLVIAALVAVSQFAGKNAMKAGGMLLMVSSALLILTGVIFLLSKMDSEGLGRALGIITVLELLFGGLIYVTKYATDCMKSLIVITVAITLLVAAVIGLSFIDPEKLATASASISMLLGTFALLVASTKNLGSPGTLAKSLLALVGVVAILAGIIIAMSKLNVESALQSAAALSILLLSMTAALSIISLVGSLSMSGVGAMALLALVVAGLAAILAVLSKLEIDSAIENAKALSTLLLAMSASLILLSVVGLLGPVAFIGIAALAVLILALTAVIVAIGAIMSEVPMLQQFLDTGLDVLIKIAGGIGEMIGAFVGGVMTQVSNSLPVIGANLSLFMTNLAPFIAGAKTIDDSVIKGVGFLAGAILALTVADLVEGVASFLSGGSSFADLGTELSNFMTNASGFLSSASSIDPAIMEGVKTLAEAILILTGANVLQGITSWLAGGSSLADFGSELSVLGTHLNQFATNLGSFDESKVTTVNCAANAIKTLAQAAKEIPNEGGLWGAIVGENSLATFANQLPGLAIHLNGFITNLGTFDESKIATVNCACDAIKALAEAAKEIPNEGGLWGAIVGENSLATFANQLPGLAIHLNGFITNLGTFDESKIATVNCACDAIKALAEAAKEIPNEGGLWGAIVGENSLATFATYLPSLGINLASFVSNLGTFTEAQVATVNSACNAIKAIVTLGDIDIKDTGSGLNSFGKNMVKFAKKVKEFVEEIGTVGSAGIDSAITKTKELVSMATSVASTNVESLKTFGNSLKKFAKDGVTGFVEEFSGESPKSKAKKAVQAMVQAGIDGAEDKKTDVEDKFSTIAEAAVDSMSSKTLTDAAAQAGKDLVTGFANGITNNKSLATDAGSSLGKAALAAAKEAIKSNSPSKEAMKVGNYFGQGLVIGIEDYETKAYSAGSNIADYAKNGLSKAISAISEMINSNMDTQPTIRPVLDLSDVQSGASTIGGLFNNVGLSANLNAISSGVNSRLQNGANDDVVYAIDKLRKDLGNVGGDTYNINGITYSDDSAINDAIRILVRAATVGRRV